MSLEKFGRYELKRELGRGGMATVFLAYDPRFKRDVAIKVLPKQFTHEPTFRARFRREAQTVAALEHPAIVPVYDFGQQNGQPYLIMRYMVGGSLTHKIKGGPLSIDETTRIIVRLATAIDSAHGAGIIHRDLKSANILFDRWDKPYLSDFGIAKLLESTGTELTPSNTAMGTPAYMSPEQIVGNLELDGRSDIYSLGVLTFEMLTGRRPYNADTPMSLAYKQVHDPVPDILKHVPSLPAQFQTVVETALAKDRDERYTSAQAMAAAISAAARHEPGYDPKTPETEMLPTEVAPPAFAGQEASTLVDQSSDFTEPLAAHRPVTDAPGRGTPTGPTEAIGAYPTGAADKKTRFKSRYLLLAGGIVALCFLSIGILGFLLNRSVFSTGDSASTPTILAGAEGAKKSSLMTATSVEMDEDQSSVATGVVLTEEATDATRLITDRATEEAAERQALIIGPDNVDKLQQKVQLGKGTVLEAVYSPDGRLLAVRSSLGVYIYDAKTLAQINMLDLGREVSDMAFSPDGSTLATGTSDDSVQLWRVDTWTLRDTLEDLNWSVRNLVFAPDGTTMASGFSGSNDEVPVYLWRLTDGELLHTLPGHTNRITSLAFSPDGSLLASGSDDNTARLWRVSDGVPEFDPLLHDEQVKSVAFSPDGDRLATASRDGQARLWQLSDASLIDTYSVSDDPGYGGSAIDLVDYSPDGNTVALGALDRRIRLWQEADDSITTLQRHTAFLNSLDFSPDGTTLASSSQDATVRIWQVNDGSLLATLEGHTNPVRSVAVSPDGSVLAVGYSDDTIRLWRADDGTLLKTIESVTGRETFRSINSLAFSPDGATLASGSDDSIVRLWRAADGEMLGTLRGHSSSVHSLAFSPDGSTLASGSDDDTIRIWQIDDGTMLETLAGHAGGINSLAFSPDGATLVSGSSDDTVRLWRMANGQLIETLEDHEDRVNTVAFSPDGSTLATLSDDDIVRLWDVGDNIVLKAVISDTARVQDLAFSPDGMVLAMGPDLRRAEDGSPLGKLEGHRSLITSLAFVPDGTTLVSGSDDGTVRLWSIELD